MMNGVDGSLVVANWKMNLSHDEALAFVAKHYDDLSNVAREAKGSLVICPPITTLYPLQAVLKDSHVKLGAQDCSNHVKGAFTGQVSVQSLKSLGCSYCIVGHSERRKYNGESNNAVAEKARLLLDYGITPIACVGENGEEFDRGATLDVLAQQLAPIIDLFSRQKCSTSHQSLYIAYEPVWAIGTGKASGLAHIEVVLSWLYKTTQSKCPGVKWRFLYGGSISAQVVAEIKKIPYVGGFLVGQASLDFQEFKKIVEYGGLGSNVVSNF